MHTYDDFEWTGREELALLARGDSPWCYYEQTTVQFDAPSSGGLVVPVTEHEYAHEPLPLGPLHVVTAVQPKGDPGCSDSAARLEVFDDELRMAGVRAIRAVGSSLEGDHAEESRAVFGLCDRQARDLGLRFGQVAVFAWNGPRWSLLACATDRQTHRGWKWTAAD